MKNITPVSFANFSLLEMKIVTVLRILHLSQPGFLLSQSAPSPMSASRSP